MGFMHSIDDYRDLVLPPGPDPVVLWVSGENRYVPRVLWKVLEGPKPDPSKFHTCDGCTASPDYWAITTGPKRGRVAIIYPCCYCHDAWYQRFAGCDLGGTWAGRRRADWLLARNIFATLLIQQTPRSEALLVATRYLGAVRFGAASHYRYDPNEKPQGFLQRTREAIAAFKATPAALEKIASGAGTS